MWSALKRNKVPEPSGPRMMGVYTQDYESLQSYRHLASDGFRRNVIVHRCVTLISRSVASVPWLLYNANEEQHEIEKHPLLQLLDHPNPKQGGAAFIEELISYLLIAGHSYVEAVCDEHRNIVELHPLRPDRVHIIPGAHGLPQAYEYRVEGHSRRIDVDQQTGHSRLLEIKLFHPLHDWRGLSPIEVAGQAIDQHNIVAGHNLSLLKNGGRPTGALMMRAPIMTDEQRRVLRRDLQEMYEGSQNAGRLMILEGDFEWREMGLSPKDMDFIEGKNQSAREIAQAFGVPPMLVGVPGDATFANYREARLHLWEDTILPLLERLVHEFNTWLPYFYPEATRLAYDLDAIPALAPKREALWARVGDADFLTLNEKRHMLGYSPLPGGDVMPSQQEASL